MMVHLGDDQHLEGDQRLDEIHVQVEFHLDVVESSISVVTSTSMRSTSVMMRSTSRWSSTST